MSKTVCYSGIVKNISSIKRVKLTKKQHCKKNSQKDVDPVTLAPIYLDWIMFIYLLFYSFKWERYVEMFIFHIPIYTQPICLWWLKRICINCFHALYFYDMFSNISSLLPIFGFIIAMFFPLSSSCVMYHPSLHSWIPSLSTPLHACILLFCLTCWILCLFIFFSKTDRVNLRVCVDVDVRGHCFALISPSAAVRQLL